MVPDYVHGPIANVFTVFHDNGTLDDEGQRNFLDALLATECVSAFFVRSGMGQMYTFQFDDVKQIARNACKHLEGLAPVLVGTSGIWDRDYDRLPDREVYTQQAVELSKYAQDVGAAGVVLTIPDALGLYPGEKVEDVCMAYFERVAEAVTIPIFLYQPGTPEPFAVTPETLRMYADIPGVKGIKVSTADAGYILDLCHAVAGHEDFAYITGNETAFYAGLCVGSTAVIGQGACINPIILRTVQDRYERGDHAGAIEAQYSANLLVRKAKHAVEFFKRYLNEKGYRMSIAARPAKNATKTRDTGSLTNEDYKAFKYLLESELAKYVRR